MDLVGIFSLMTNAGYHYAEINTTDEGNWNCVWSTAAGIRGKLIEVNIDKNGLVSVDTDQTKQYLGANQSLHLFLRKLLTKGEI